MTVKIRFKMKMRKFTKVGFSCCLVNSQNNFWVAYLFVWYKQNDIKSLNKKFTKNHISFPFLYIFWVLAKNFTSNV